LAARQPAGRLPTISLRPIRRSRRLSIGGRFHNQAATGVETALTAILGREAAYGGRELSLEELVRSNQHWDAWLKGMI